MLLASAPAIYVCEWRVCVMSKCVHHCCRGCI